MSYRICLGSVVNHRHSTTSLLFRTTFNFVHSG